MNPVLTTTASILAIAGAMWMIRRMLRIQLCPICLGVGGTWLWMLIARELDYAVNTTMLAILVGGSVAAVADQVEKRLPAHRSTLLWKTLFLPPAFAGAYALITRHWVLLVPVVIGLIGLTMFFLHSSGAAQESNENVDELTRKMKNCC